MYAFSNSLLKMVSEYRVEIYSMEVFGYDASVYIELTVFGEGIPEIYIAKYEITRADEKTTIGGCMNEPTKERLFVAVEEAVIRVLENEDQYYWEYQ